MKIYLKKAACNFKWSCESETISDDVIDLVVMMVRWITIITKIILMYSPILESCICISMIRLNLMIMSKDRCWES